MNKIIVSGNLCKDIELKISSSGKSFLNNTIAVRNDFKNANGEYSSQFFNFTVWGTSAEYLSKNACKGSKVLIEGRLSNREYDKSDGTKGYATEIICNSIELFTKQKVEEIKSESAEEVNADPYTTFGNTITTDDIDDLDLPFE